MLETVSYEGSSERPSRVIKRYSNRKLYDTKSSRYVTLLQIADMVRAGDEVQIIDNRTKEDKTEVTLALIISEELKNTPGGIPLNTLRALIRHDSTPPPSGPPVSGATVAMSRQFVSSEAAARSGNYRVGGGEGSNYQEASVADQTGSAQGGAAGIAQAREKFEEWQAAMDERMRDMPDSRDLEALQRHVERLDERLAELERRIGQK